jgi:DNA-binding MarR family transcriptional regulator
MARTRARYIPEWLFKRYAQLYKEVNLNEFSMEDSKRILGGKEKLVYDVLSELTKAGWMTRRFHPIDARKRIYQLRDPGEVIMEIIEGLSESNFK